MVVELTRYGKKYFLINSYIRGIIGLILIILGIISAIIYGKMMLIMSLVGVIALLNAWYMWRRSHSPSGKDIVAPK